MIMRRKSRRRKRKRKGRRTREGRENLRAAMLAFSSTGAKKKTPTIVSIPDYRLTKHLPGGGGRGKGGGRTSANQGGRKGGGISGPHGG